MGPVADQRARIRHAQLANMRQELLAPVAAIIGYGEFLIEGARDGGLAGMVGDLDRILTAANTLAGIMDGVLEAGAAGKLFAGRDAAQVARELRHDLRNPLNAIVGYTEMMIEDLDELGGARLAPDLEKLLSEANRLLAGLDTIVDFSRAEQADDETGGHAAGTSSMFADIVRSIEPVQAHAAAPIEAGHIQVVDDLESNREILSRRLARHGHHVAVAGGGAEALRMVGSEAFDLILLDLMMPDMNGYEVLARLKSEPGTRDIPVIMISALDELDSVVRCIDSGAEDYLAKPVNPILLRSRIDACLERKRLHESLQDEKQKFETLLVNILPRSVVERLNAGETVIADRFDGVTVLFADLVGFTEISGKMSPAALVEMLNRLFSRFDALAFETGVEKIKTIGDGYMAVAGLPEPRPDHAAAVARLAVKMTEAVIGMNEDGQAALGIRIGIHSGPVVAGIIGTHRFIYDVWGDTVNVASRMESTCPANRIQLSAATRDLLPDSWQLAPRGAIDIKGKGKMETYFLDTES